MLIDLRRLLLFFLLLSHSSQLVFLNNRIITKKSSLRKTKAIIMQMISFELALEQHNQIQISHIKLIPEYRCVVSWINIKCIINRFENRHRLIMSRINKP